MPPPLGCYCGDSEWDLLVRILEQDIASFDRQQQILEAINSSDLTTENSNINGINGVPPSVGCGVATEGTLRVAQATDCNVAVVGNVANDAVDSGNPVKVGAQARTTLPTAVADGDRVNLMAGKHGSLVTIHALREMLAQQVTTITASTVETLIVTAVAAVFLDLYGIIVTNTSATAVNVAIKDATAGTTRINIAVPANETRGFMLPACDGHKQAVVTNNWTATVSASVTSVIITAFTRQTT